MHLSGIFIIKNPLTSQPSPQLSNIFVSDNELTSVTGEKEKRRKEERTLEAQNQQAAGGAYASPDVSDLEHDNGQSGLPWGGVSIRHVVEKGKAKEESRRTSREGSVNWGQSRREEPSR
jgi:hypothetical protein